MLKTIVENNQINLRKTFSNNPNPLHSFFAYRNQYFGMFQFNLFGFITDGTQPSLMAAIRLQADGFITKRLSVQQLAAQVHLAAGGEMVISDSLTAALAVSLRNVPVADDSRDISRLSPREVDVLYCIANGMSNRQISEHLKISDGTVKVHVKHVLKKLGFATRVEAALWASESGHKGSIAQTYSR